MAVTVAVRVTWVVIGAVGVTGPVPAPRTATGSATVAVAGGVPVSRVAMAGALSRAGSMIVTTAGSGARTSPAAGRGRGPN